MINCRPIYTCCNKIYPSISTKYIQHNLLPTTVIYYSMTTLMLLLNFWCVTGGCSYYAITFSSCHACSCCHSVQPCTLPSITLHHVYTLLSTNVHSDYIFIYCTACTCILYQIYFEWDEIICSSA